MAIFQPFAGVRYDLDKVDLADVVAPPYDVIDAAGRARLEARSPYNAVRVELAATEDGEGRYDAVHRRFEGWLAEGVLSRDSEPSFYVYRMGWHDDEGRPHQTTGVFGALGAVDARPGRGAAARADDGEAEERPPQPAAGDQGEPLGCVDALAGERAVRPPRRL